MATTIRTVTTSLQAVSMFIVFPLSKPLSLLQPLPVIYYKMQSSGRRLRGMPCDGETSGIRRDRGTLNADGTSDTQRTLPAGCHAANMLAVNIDV
jgi:hypothetical protein